MIGKTLSHFKITAKLGEGGMGEVYRAEDTRLGREVAIKVLPEDFTSDPERLARFEREARVLASLNHPNIAGIHQIEEADEQRLLVMELVEGEDLADLLERGSIPTEAAVGIALQVAEGLEAAHERGIVHRDLKPANIKIRPDRQVKILDFGLAKAHEAAEKASPDATRSPTLTAQMTQAGVILGTAAYMSPEQARGQEVDKRSDIWSYGAVLYEMLSGRRGFAGDTVQDTLAKVLTSRPDLDQLPQSLPGALVRLIERCLEPDPTIRLRDIGEARIQLQQLDRESPVSSDRPTTSESRRWRGFALAGAGALILGILGTWSLVPRGSDPPLRKLTLDIGALDATWDVHPAISPDGRKILYGARSKLWVQDLAQLEPRELPGSFNPRYPSWSPDSEQVAFEARGQLWKVPISGGRPVPVAPYPSDFAGSGASAWLADGTIVISGGELAGLMSVSDQGGQFEPLRALAEDEIDLHEMTVLPDGRTLLFVRHRKDPEETRRLVDSISVLRDGVEEEVLFLEGEALQSVAYSPSGHLLFSRGTGTPGLWAIPFDVDSLKANGAPFLVAAQARLPSVAGDGSLLMVQGLMLQLTELVGIDRQGEVQWKSGRTQPGVEGPAVSPDGKTLAVTAFENNNWDVWLYDLEGTTHTRLTFETTVEGSVAWSPDGRQVAVDINDLHTVAIMPTAGGTLQHLVEGSQPDWSRDGNELLHTRFLTETPSWDLYGHSFSSGESTPILSTEADELQPRLSPDGSLLAYVSNESGAFEVYAQTYPDAASKVQVSSGGGLWPQWSGDGRTLFFVGDDRLLEVSFSDRDRLAPSPPQALFSLSSLGLDLGSRGFAVSPDGKIFFLPRQVNDPARKSSLVLVQSWFDEFRGDS